MTDIEKLLKKEIVKAKKILILSHKGPDVDAFCSMLLIHKILKDIFPEKEIIIKARQYPNVKLPWMKNIQIVEKEEAITPEDEDLIIATDCSEWRMIMEDQDTINTSKAPIIFVDHHKTETDQPLVINEMRSSATEQVYVTFKKIFKKKFNLDSDVASLVQYGIVSDTKRFLFLTTPDTFRIFGEVMEVEKIDIEEYEYKSSKFPREATEVIIEYLKNLTIEGDMSYMYISNDIINRKGFEKQAVNHAYTFLKDNYLRFIQGVHWGFIVKPMFSEEGKWSISFRSTKGYQNVEEIATKLGGGGHRYSAATKLRAESVEDLLDTVLAFIGEVVYE